MWTPDLRTLFLILFLVNAFLALMLYTFWKTQKTYDGFMTWMLSLMVISCGYFLFMLRGSVSDLLSIIAASILIQLSVIMRLDSIRRYFWSTPVPFLWYGILVPFAALYFYYTYSVDSVLLRTLISNAIIVPCLLVTALLALRPDELESRPLRLGFAASLAVVSILLTLRIISWMITAGDFSLFSTDPLNTIVFVVTILTDILSTGFFLMLNMARSQTELRASEEKFRQLFTRMPSAVAIYDAVDRGEDFVFKDFNVAAEKTEGLKKEELAGRRVTQVFPGVKDFGIFAVLQRVWRTGQPEFVPSALYRDERDAGTWRESWVYKLASGELITIYHDITERKRAEDALRLSNKKLSLLSGITRHDINNQLTVLQGYLSILETKLPDPTLSAYFLKMATAAQRIAAMIRFTREYEQIGVLAPAWQDLRMLVDAAAMEAPLGQVTVKNELPAGTDVFADPLVVRVFYNLMDNAVRYGEKCTTIRFSVEESGDGPVIVCEDDGAGVSAGEKEQIFERGYGKNTGLGLALAREILAITGITIRETGEPGKGARFEMAVPEDMWRFAGSDRKGD